MTTVKVHEIKNPERDAWEMSEEGFGRLDKKFPGQYAKLSKFKIVPDEKKIQVVAETTNTVGHLNPKQANPKPKQRDKK